MLQQEAMIERTRRVCKEDERLTAAMMNGSFAQGEGDGFSDIEFILFFRDEELEGFDQEEWVSRISPVGLYFVNEYGNGTAIIRSNYLPPEGIRFYDRSAACTARLDRDELRQAYLSAWQWGRELMAFLAARHGVAPPTALLVRLDRRCAETFSAPGPEDS
jgi:predicted nucleotidyltransferase